MTLVCIRYHFIFVTVLCNTYLFGPKWSINYYYYYKRSAHQTRLVINRHWFSRQCTESLDHRHGLHMHLSGCDFVKQYTDALGRKCGWYLLVRNLADRVQTLWAAGTDDTVICQTIYSRLRLQTLVGTVINGIAPIDTSVLVMYCLILNS